MAAFGRRISRQRLHVSFRDRRATSLRTIHAPGARRRATLLPPHLRKFLCHRNWPTHPRTHFTMNHELSGLYLVTPDWDDTAKLIASSESALKGGATILQYRHKT